MISKLPLSKSPSKQCNRVTNNLASPKQANVRDHGSINKQKQSNKSNNANNQNQEIFNKFSKYIKDKTLMKEELSNL